MLVILVFINFQFLAHGPPQLGFGQHAQDRVLDYQFGLTLKPLAKVFLPQSTGKTSVVAVNLLLRFHSGDPDLPRIDHNHVVAGIEERRKIRVLFAPENAGDTRFQPPKCLPGGVYDIPFARNFLPAWNTG